MPLITDFGPAVQEALRQFSLVQNRAIDESSPLVHVTAGRCSLCGFEVENDYECPSDTLRAVTMLHELSWVSGKRCGGQMLFVTSPVGIPSATLAGTAIAGQLTGVYGAGGLNV